MTRKFNFKAITLAMLITFLANYILCIATDQIFGWTMYKIWAPLVPGFTWPLTLQGFLIGLVWLILYSFFLAALIVWPYNLVVHRESE